MFMDKTRSVDKPKECLMENPTPRALAYLLATPIQNELYETTVGGSNPTSICFTNNQTFKATGDSAQGADMHVDLSLDC